MHQASVKPCLTWQPSCRSGGSSWGSLGHRGAWGIAPPHPPAAATAQGRAWGFQPPSPAPEPESVPTEFQFYLIEETKIRGAVVVFPLQKLLVFLESKGPRAL